MVQNRKLRCRLFTPAILYAPRGLDHNLVEITAMKSGLVRLLSGACGLFAGLLAIYLPVNFVAMTIQERESAHQYNGHVSISGTLGGSIVVLIVTLFFGLGAYILIKRALSTNRADDAGGSGERQSLLGCGSRHC